MTAQDDGYSPKMHAAPYPGGGREPTLDVPPRSNRAEEEDETPGSEAGAPPSGSRSAETPSSQAASQAPGQTPGQTSGQAPGQTSGPDVSGELEKAKAEIAEYKDRALRAVAEFENFRRRAEKEREDVAKYAISNFAREMLPVADNLRRALDSQPAVEGEAAPPLKAFVAGVELTERELLAAFERFGLKKIDPMGQPFDHNFHQAMFEIEDPNQPAGTVVQVMQAGYLLKDRLLRPALVGVSKGGPARAAGERSEGAASAANDAYAAPGGNDGHTIDTKA